MTATAEPTTDLIGDRIRIGKQRNMALALIEECEEQLAAIDRQLLDDWTENQTNHINREGVTLYMHRGRYALPRVDDITLCAALDQAGLGSIVKTAVNKLTLTATLKELDEQGGIPESLRAVVELKDRYSIRMRGAK